MLVSTWESTGHLLLAFIVPAELPDKENNDSLIPCYPSKDCEQLINLDTEGVTLCGVVCAPVWDLPSEE